jgi:hypothetical protein
MMTLHGHSQQNPISFKASARVPVSGVSEIAVLKNSLLVG